jgi:uncharacterized protein
MVQWFAFIALLHGYVAWRLLPSLPFGVPAVVALSSWLVASAVLVPLGFAVRRMHRLPLADILAWSGLLMMGAFSSLFVLTFLRDVALLLGHLGSGWIAAPDTLRIFRIDSAAAVPVAAALASLLGLYSARKRAGVRLVDVPITNLPESLHGFTIAQISDIHVGPTIKRNYLDAIVDAVNELGADLIAVTGDLVDGSVAQLARHTQPLGRLSARHGAYFVTGNHEYYSGVESWVAEIRRLGLRVLMNEHVVLLHEGATVVVGGVTDHGAHHYDPAQRSDPAAAMVGSPRNADFRLLLAHQPRSAFAAAPVGFDLQLSGHTHGGQFLPWTFLVRLQQPITAGLHRIQSLWVYVSRGTGYWGPPLRLGAPSEITHLRLVPA